MDLADIDLIIFDKDGTLIDFHAMWSGWAETLIDDLEVATGRDVRSPLLQALGYDPVTRRARVGGGLISTPMARLRDLTIDVVESAGATRSEAEAALAVAWHAPDPVALAHPLTDLVTFFGALRATGRRLAIATSDDREPTLRTLSALGIDAMIDAVVCADDGPANKPAPDPVLYLCRRLDVPPRRTAVVGDSPADVQMSRAAGAGLVIGVRTGVGSDADLSDADVIVDSVASLI